MVDLTDLSATQSGIVQIAYNFDKPVIATRVGGLAEVIVEGKTGYLVPPNNADALADALLKFYTEQREGEFGANARLEKSKYTWDNLVSSIESMMKDTVK